MKATTKAFEHKKSFRKFINQNLCKDGKTLVVLSTSGVPLFDAEGNFIGYRGADMDITDQYIAEKKLQVSEEHLRSLMESASGFAIYRLVYDKVSPHSLRVIFVSPSIKGIFGIPDPMKFKSWFENIHPDDVNRLTEANKRAFETNRFNEEFRTYNEKKGEWRWVQAISTGGVNKKGWNRYVNGILIDITERKVSEEALKSKERELETKANKLEDINTALNVLLEKRKVDQIEIEEKIVLNVENLIKPYLDKLRQGSLDDRKKNILNIIQSNLDEIISPFTRNLSSRHYNLTPKEIQIANFIRQGTTNKEIAEILFLSVKTVEFHRDNIRKKLGIKNKKINLTSHLSSID
jgi:PAS domain S-box-containing protein